MTEAVRVILLKACLVAFAASLSALVLAGWRGGLTSAAGKLLSLWLGMTRLGRAVAVWFLIVCVSYGGGKTNGLLRIVTWPVRMLLGRDASLSDSQRAEYVWNTRGAWDDFFWFDFEDGWRFPWGTNSLSGVKVLACGELWASGGGTNAVARLGVPVAIVPGLTTFAAELTPSNTYRFSWTDAAQNRDTNALVSASVELMRNGDRRMTVNGVETCIPRELPFPHDGFGQDGEWVAANFTNVADIAQAGGYAAWVDGQVGSGLANGLYKLTVNVAGIPPETMRIAVGERSIAVTNAGDYVFLLEKGPSYGFSVFPPSGGVTISAVDDVAPAMRRVAGRASGPDGSVVRGWTADGGGFETDYTPGAGSAQLWWLPRLCGSPDILHIGPGDAVEFTALVDDFCGTDGVSFHWEASEGLALSAPDAQTTAVSVESMPSWASAWASVTATFGGRTLTSFLDGLSFGTNETPQVHGSIVLPEFLLVRDEWMEGSESAAVHVSFTSDIETNGTVRVWAEGGGDRISTSPALPVEFNVYGGAAERVFTIDGVAQSLSAGDVRLCCAFTGGCGATNALGSASTTVVSAKRVLVPSAPDTGLCVLKGAQVAASLEMEPVVGGVPVRWQTARRKTKTQYDRWTERCGGSLNASLAMDEAGVFALRAVAVCGGGCQSNAVEYVHSADEPYVDAINERRGPVKAGERNHIGVAATPGLLNLRNAALAHLGNAEYGTDMYVRPSHGFSLFKPKDNKCNRFVADVAFEAGLSVPVMHVTTRTWPAPDGAYPPIANEWANGNVDIPGWVYLGKDVYPEPGFIAGHPSPTHGHCGIVDYDGWTISARPYGVGRKSESMLDGNCGYNKPTEEDENEE